MKQTKGVIDTEGMTKIEKYNCLIANHVGTWNNRCIDWHWEFPEGLGIPDELLDRDIFTSDLRFHESWDWIMPVLDFIHLPKRVKIYGVYRDINGEDVDIITHRASQSNRWITLKIEYGRRFKEFTHYRGEGETMKEPTVRLILDYINWYNEHQ